MQGKPMMSFQFFVLVAMILSSLSICMAEEKTADTMQMLVGKIKADKKLLIAENMQLTEAEAKAFWPVYDQYQTELFLLRARTMELIKNYTDAYEKMTNATAKKLLEEYMTIEALRMKLGKSYLPRFRAVLPDVKVMRYYQLENKINAVLYYELAGSIPLAKTEIP